MRLRASRHLSSLEEFVTDWRKGKFTREHTSKENLSDKFFFCSHATHVVTAEVLSLIIFRTEPSQVK